VTINLAGIKGKKVTGEILTSKHIGDHNSFDRPDVVKTAEFKGAKITKEGLTVTLPAMSIVTLAIN
jgi:alpha-N-arabinofuranosidase